VLEKDRPKPPHEHPKPLRPEDPREVEMRSIAEDLVDVLESVDHGRKVEAVANILNRFELKKPHPHHPKPSEHPLPPEPGLDHPRPPAPDEHPEPPRHHHPRP